MTNFNPATCTACNVTCANTGAMKSHLRSKAHTANQAAFEAAAIDAAEPALGFNDGLTDEAAATILAGIANQPVENIKSAGTTCYACDPINGVTTHGLEAYLKHEKSESHQAAWEAARVRLLPMEEPTACKVAVPVPGARCVLEVNEHAVADLFEALGHGLEFSRIKSRARVELDSAGAAEAWIQQFETAMAAPACKKYVKTYTRLRDTAQAFLSTVS